MPCSHLLSDGIMCDVYFDMSYSYSVGVWRGMFFELWIPVVSTSLLLHEFLFCQLRVACIRINEAELSFWSVWVKLASFMLPGNCIIQEN